MDIIIYGIPFVIALLLYIASVLYGTHRSTSIWMFFSAGVLCLLAVCLYWQQRVMGELENPPFAVAIETGFEHDRRDSPYIFCEYNRNMLSPVPLVLFVRLVNLQEIPANISQLTVEVERRRSRWISPSAWIATKQVPEQMPLIWRRTPPQLSLRLDLIGQRLLPLIKSRPLQPHETIRGWLLMDIGAEYDDAPRPLVHRITIKDTAGRKFTTVIGGPSGEENILPPRGFEVDPTNAANLIDIQNHTIRHLADF